MFKFGWMIPNIYCNSMDWTAGYLARGCKLGRTSYDRTIGINIQPKKQIR